MSALSGYTTQVQRLLHDSRAQFWSTSELQDYINEARIRTVRDTGAYRVLQPLYLSTGVEKYNYGGVTGFSITAPGNGYTSTPSVAIAAPAGGGVTATASATITNGTLTQIVINNQGTNYLTAPAVVITGGGGTGAAATAYPISQQTLDVINLTIYWGQSRIVCGRVAWSLFNSRARYYVNYLGTPGLMAVYSYNSMYVAKIPDQPYQAEIDTVIQPPLLLDDTTLEVIPPGFQDPVQYFSAYLAKIKEQSWGEAEKFMMLYDREILKAINSSFTVSAPNPYKGR